MTTTMTTTGMHAGTVVVVVSLARRLSAVSKRQLVQNINALVAPSRSLRKLVEQQSAKISSAVNLRLSAVSSTAIEVS
jgi:hypothetical protein